MMEELLHLLSPYNYTGNVAHLLVKDVFPQKLYALTELSDNYSMDTRWCYQSRRKNSNQIFELFAALNNDDPVNVCKDMITQIMDEKSLYSSIGANHLKKLKLSIDEWLRLMSWESVFANELMIFALSRTYQCHTVIFTHNMCWTTINTNEPIKGHRLLGICRVHLIYIGIHMFAELKRWLFIPITSTELMEPPSSIPPCITNSDSSSTTTCAIDLSTKPVKSEKSDNDHGCTNVSDDYEHTTLASPSTSLQDAQSDRETTGVISDTLSENLLTGKPIVYQDIQEVDNQTRSIPGINTEISKKSETTLQSPYNASENTNCEPSVMKGVNNTSTNTAELGINISLEPEQNKSTMKFDPYIDASLSGTLECIHVEECILSIAANCDSHKNAYQDQSLVDHNYFNSRNATKRSTKPSITQPTNDPDEHLNRLCNHVSKEVSLGMDKYGVQSDDIETKIVCMEFTEMDITTVQESFIHTHQAPCNIPGTNTLTNTVHNTESTMDDTLAAFKDINISGGSGTVLGTNDEYWQKNKIGINMGTVKGTNNTEPAPSETPMTGNMQANIIRGINNQDNSSSESSEFESFTSGDLKCNNMSDAVFNNDSSTILTSDYYTYDDAVEDYSDTIPAIGPINNTEETPQELHNLPSVGSNSNTILPEIVNIWEKDAMTKKWTVPLCRLTPTDIFTLSNSTPNWDTMNPYSSLDKAHESANEPKPKSVTSSTPNKHPDHVKNKSQLYKKLQRSYWTGKHVAYLEESTSNDNDSDYEPSPKPVGNNNVGLKAPSSTRICAQNIIRSAKENSEAGKKAIITKHHWWWKEPKMPLL